jgi:hypothetical protein
MDESGALNLHAVMGLLLVFAPMQRSIYLSKFRKGLGSRHGALKVDHNLLS